MRGFQSWILIAVAFWALTSMASRSAAQRSVKAGPAKDVAVTVYSSASPGNFDPQSFHNRFDDVPGFGVVKETRTVDFPKGTILARLKNVAEHIDPTTVSLTDLDAPEATKVLEQEFQFDLVSSSKLLDKYIDRQVRVSELGPGGGQKVHKGTLLSTERQQMVIKTKDGLTLVPRGRNTRVHLGKLPNGLVTKPTLVWKLKSDQAGKRQVRTTYQTKGITWRADYNLLLNKDDTKGSLSAWVTLLNRSGATYDQARLKLIAGDVSRENTGNATIFGSGGNEGGGFKERSFFEYHLYTLPRRTTVKQNSTKQITLFPTKRGINLNKQYVYYGSKPQIHYIFNGSDWDEREFGLSSNKKVDVYIAFMNSKKNHLGMAIPRGKIRLYKRDRQGQGDHGTLEFIGEDLVDHTPTNERIRAKVGEAFDIVGERKQTDFTINRGGAWLKESIRIELRNHKKQPVKVHVAETLYRRSDWEIVKKSDEFEKLNSTLIHFPVRVPAGGKKVVTYTVKYTW